MDSSAAIVEFTRVYLAVFYSGVAAFYATRIAVKKRDESCDIVFPGLRFSTTWWNHRLFSVFRMTIWMVCVARCFFPALDSYLGLFVGLNVGPVLLAGNMLLTVGFALALGVHFSLGRQWRSGIDPAGPTELRTDGFYSISRNPMFLGVATAQVGFLLALPSVFSAICLLVGWYTLHQQSLAEEAHLMRTFPSGYARYKNAVRRWL